MAKMKVSVFRTKTEADACSLDLQNLGWQVRAPRALERVLWQNECFGGIDNTAADEDGEVWIVQAEK